MDKPTVLKIEISWSFSLPIFCWEIISPISPLIFVLSNLPFWIGMIRSPASVRAASIESTYILSAFKRV